MVWLSNDISQSLFQAQYIQKKQVEMKFTSYLTELQQSVGSHVLFEKADMD